VGTQKRLHVRETTAHERKKNNGDQIDQGNGKGVRGKKNSSPKSERKAQKKKGPAVLPLSAIGTKKQVCMGHQRGGSQHATKKTQEEGGEQEGGVVWPFRKSFNTIHLGTLVRRSFSLLKQREERENKKGTKRA